MLSPEERKAQPKYVTVARVEPVTKDLRRVVLTGEDLRLLPDLPFADHYIKLFFPPEGADYAHPFDVEEIRRTRPRELWPVTRTMTIRRFDREALELTLEIHLHDGGLAGPWARDAQPGDPIAFRGPGGKWAPTPGAPALLLVGDEAAQPAICRALEMVDPATRTLVFVEVATPAEEIELPGQAEVRWFHRGDTVPGIMLGEAVRRAYAAGELPADLEAFVHGNADMIKDLRRLLFLEMGLPRHKASITGYWRTGLTEDEWQATKKEFMFRVEQEEQLN